MLTLLKLTQIPTKDCIKYYYVKQNNFNFNNNLQFCLLHYFFSTAKTVAQYDKVPTMTEIQSLL